MSLPTAIQACPICQILPVTASFYAVCSDRGETAKKCAVRANCCYDCLIKLRKKQKLQPLFVVGTALVVVALFGAFKGARVIGNRPELQLVLLGMVVLGFGLLITGALFALAVGNTEIQHLPLKNFVARTFRDALGIFGPKIAFMTACAANLTAVSFEESLVPTEELPDSEE